MPTFSVILLTDSKHCTGASYGNATSSDPGV